MLTICPSIEPESVANMGVGLEDTFQLLGWEIKRIQEDIPRAESVFDCLGVIFDLGESAMGAGACESESQQDRESCRACRRGSTRRDIYAQGC